MPVETLISLTDEQDAYVRAVVASGCFASVGAVLQHGLELVRQDAAAHADRIPALQELIAKKRAGRFVPIKDADGFLATMERES